jgi:hypothetical protein
MPPPPRILDGVSILDMRLDLLFDLDGDESGETTGDDSCPSSPLHSVS